MHKEDNKHLYRACCACIITVFVSMMFLLVWFYFVRDNNETGHLLGKANIGMSLGLYTALYIILGRTAKAFNIGVDRKANIVAAQIITLFLTDAVELFFSLAITGQYRFFWRLLRRYLLLWVAQSVVISIVSIVMIDIYHRKYPPLKIVEVFGDYKNDLYSSFNNVFYKYRIIERYHYSEFSLNEVLDRCDAILINDVPSKFENELLKGCFSSDKRVYFVPKISDILKRSSDDLNFFDTPLFLCRNNGVSAYVLIIKRLFDIFASSMALVLLSPILIVTAVAIKLDDGGPVFYKQERCTLNGRHFNILKFRSMIVDAEKDGRSHPAGENDDRITKVGKVIRATRIDELPQLINIIKGDMSLVGPRPERIEHVMKYTEDIPEFAFRDKVRGGLTGYAQVYGKYNTSALDKLKMDLIYITNCSLLLDFQIIIETIKIIFRKESTEGFSESQAKELHDYSIRRDE